LYGVLLVNKLDAWQSPTLARPAVPLATGVTDLSSWQLVVMATSLEGSKNKFHRLIVYKHENLVRYETGLRRIVKNKKQKQNVARRVCFQQPGWLNK